MLLICEFILILTIRKKSLQDLHLGHEEDGFGRTTKFEKESEIVMFMESPINGCSGTFSLLLDLSLK
jgi:hypothetical protein